MTRVRALVSRSALGMLPLSPNRDHSQVSLLVQGKRRREAGGPIANSSIRWSTDSLL
jgi:hypothetical protein